MWKSNVYVLLFYFYSLINMPAALLILINNIHSVELLNEVNFTNLYPYLLRLSNFI